MWTERLIASAALMSLMSPAAADYPNAPFHDRPFEVGELALRVLDGEDVPIPSGDVPLTAAVASVLLLSEIGLGEAFEAAVGGDDDDDGGDDPATDAQGGYGAAYALLEAARPWVVAVPQDPLVDDMLSRLDALMPTPERPETLDADPEAAEVVTQALVGHLERAANTDLYLGRDMRRALETVSGMAERACADQSPERLRMFEITALYYEDALEAPLSVMASEPAARIETALDALTEGETKACADISSGFGDAMKVLFP